MKDFVSYGIIGLCFLMISLQNLVAGEKTDSTISEETIKLWKTMAPFYAPSNQFKDNFGKYKSPLKFYDGRIVKTAADWRQRRQEILKKWHTMMGEWPLL